MSQFRPLGRRDSRCACSVILIWEAAVDWLSRCFLFVGLQNVLVKNRVGGILYTTVIHLYSILLYTIFFFISSVNFYRQQAKI